ncbi:MAG: 6-bladed beta-propeller [Cyclobacteriaceae bacterium]|nr:6-bladed beta-propeller [Cyclobacteriaceae bacterium]
MQTLLPATAQDMVPAELNIDASEEPIIWIEKFPDETKKPKKKGLMARLGQLITGKDDIDGLSKPVAVLGISPGNYWALDQGHETIVRVEDHEAKALPFVLKKNGRLPYLIDICQLSGNQMLFSESSENVVYLLSPEKKEIVPFNKDTLLSQPTGVAFSKINNEVWVVETKKHRVAVFDMEGKFLRAIGVRGTGPGEFNFPTYIWIDALGNAYIVDAMNFRIQILDKKGKLMSMFGNAGNESGYFSRPKGIAVDSKGHIYVVDGLFHNVQIFDKEGNFLYYFGQQGREDGNFWMPSGIHIDENDFIYIADSYNFRIQVFKLNYGG